jgi:hypothetical protein
LKAGLASVHLSFGQNGKSAAIAARSQKWNFTINDQELIGTWQYTVTQHSAQLVLMRTILTSSKW